MPQKLFVVHDCKIAPCEFLDGRPSKMDGYVIRWAIRMGNCMYYFVRDYEEFEVACLKLTLHDEETVSVGYKARVGKTTLSFEQVQQIMDVALEDFSQKGLKYVQKVILNRLVCKGPEDCFKDDAWTVQPSAYSISTCKCILM